MERSPKARHLRLISAPLVVWLLSLSSLVGAQTPRFESIGVSYALPSGWISTRDSTWFELMRTRLVHAYDHPEIGARLWVWGTCTTCIANPAQRLVDDLDFLAVLASNVEYRTTVPPSETTISGRNVQVATGTNVSRTTGQPQALVTLIVPDGRGTGLGLLMYGPAAHEASLVEVIARLTASLTTTSPPRIDGVPRPLLGRWQRSSNLGGQFGSGGNNTEESWQFAEDGSYVYRYASSTYMPGVSIAPTVREEAGRWQPLPDGRVLIFRAGDGRGQLVEVRREGAFLIIDGVRFLPRE